MPRALRACPRSTVVISPERYPRPGGAHTPEAELSGAGRILDPALGGGLEALGQFDQQTRGEAGGTLRELAVVAVAGGGSGDVEVGPRDPVAHELLEDQPGEERAGTGVPAADVLHV